MDSLPLLPLSNSQISPKDLANSWLEMGSMNNVIKTENMVPRTDPMAWQSSSSHGCSPMAEWDLPPMLPNLPSQPTHNHNTGYEPYDRCSGLRKASPGIRASRKKTTIACIHCVKAKAGCDRKRPCGRCVRLGKRNCIDRPINPRYKPRKTSRPDLGQMIRHGDDTKEILRSLFKEEQIDLSKDTLPLPPRRQQPDMSGGAMNMSAKLLLDPYFATAYGAAERTAQAWTQYFKTQPSGWDDEAKKVMAALLTWMACSDHQACANQLYEELLSAANVTTVEPVQILASWKPSSSSAIVPTVTYSFDYSKMGGSSDSALHCQIEYNSSVVRLFDGEEVFRAMVPLSIKWIRLEDWGNFVKDMLRAHVAPRARVQLHPVVRHYADVEFEFEGQMGGSTRGRMKSIRATMNQAGSPMSLSPCPAPASPEEFLNEI